MPAADSRRPREEYARLGRTAYSHVVEPQLRPEDDGKFVVLDIDTGDYELDADELAAAARMKARKPDADLWLECVGQPAAYRLRSPR